MKVSVQEFDGCFSIELKAESMEEAALLVRLGMNRTEEIRSAGTHVYQDGRFESSLVFAKSRRANSDVPKRK